MLKQILIICIFSYLLLSSSWATGSSCALNYQIIARDFQNKHIKQTTIKAAKKTSEVALGSVKWTHKKIQTWQQEYINTIKERGWLYIFQTLKKKPKKLNPLTAFTSPAGLISEAVSLGRQWRGYPANISRPRAPIAIASSIPISIAAVMMIDQEMLKDHLSNTEQDLLGAEYLMNAFKSGFLDNYHKFDLIYNPKKLEYITGEHQTLISDYFSGQRKNLPRYGEFVRLNAIQISRKDLSEIIELAKIANTSFQLAKEKFQTGESKFILADSVINQFFFEQLAKSEIFKRKSPAEIALIRTLFQPIVFSAGESLTSRYAKVLGLILAESDLNQKQKMLYKAYKIAAQNIWPTEVPNFLAEFQNKLIDPKIDEVKKAALLDIPNFPQNKLYIAYRSEDLDISIDPIEIINPDLSQHTISGELAFIRLLFTDNRFLSIAIAWKEARIELDQAIHLLRISVQKYNELYYKQNSGI